MLLYPTTLITRFIPAYFTDGYEQGFKTRAIPKTTALAAQVKDKSLRNQVGLSTLSATNISGIVEDALQFGVKNESEQAVTSPKP